MNGLLNALSSIPVQPTLSLVAAALILFIGAVFTFYQ